MIASAGAAFGSASMTISGGTVSNTKTIAAEATVPNALSLFVGQGDAMVTIDATSLTNAGTLEALAVSGGIAATDVTATATSNTGVIKALASSAGQTSMQLGGGGMLCHPNEDDEDGGDKEPALAALERHPSVPYSAIGHSGEVVVYGPAGVYSDGTGS
jgi:hypothetical protein